MAARVAAEQTARGFTRYSSELREVLIAGALAARESGEAVTVFATANGVSAPTLFGWLRERQSFVRVRPVTRAKTFAPVVSTLTVIDMASGVHVEGCTLQEAAALMREQRE